LGSIRELFDKAANKDRTPAMGELTERNLARITEKFFQELGGMGLSVRDLQQLQGTVQGRGSGRQCPLPWPGRLG
jgi:hypothetical protein